MGASKKQSTDALFFWLVNPLDFLPECKEHESNRFPCGASSKLGSQSHMPKCWTVRTRRSNWGTFIKGFRWKYSAAFFSEFTCHMSLCNRYTVHLGLFMIIWCVAACTFVVSSHVRKHSLNTAYTQQAFGQLPKIMIWATVHPFGLGWSRSWGRTHQIRCDVI